MSILDIFCTYFNCWVLIPCSEIDKHFNEEFLFLGHALRDKQSTFVTTINAKLSQECSLYLASS